MKYRVVRVETGAPIAGAPVPLRILVAEDETIIRMDLRSLLEAQGHDVVEARDGIEAVEFARELEPDLAIMDVKMPRLDGIEAAQRIRAERPLPIVMLTAFGESELVRRAVDAGVFAYLVKPFREQDVLPAIETAFARHGELLRARRELGSRPRSLDVTLPAAGGGNWPVRIERRPDGGVDVGLTP